MPTCLTNQLGACLLNPSDYLLALQRLANYPFRILHIAEDYTWDEFVFVNKEGKEYIREKVKYSPHAGMVGEMSYMRRTYKHGRMVWYGNPSDGKTTRFIPFDTANENLRQKLIELFQ